MQGRKAKEQEVYHGCTHHIAVADGCHRLHRPLQRYGVHREEIVHIRVGVRVVLCTTSDQRTRKVMELQDIMSDKICALTCDPVVRLSQHCVVLELHDKSPQARNLRNSIHAR